ncbi:MAG: hypothetical protein KDC53_07560 [Saprospiraceae bacterium]|nr:hypothetical protein [Saprospiraceae bacterium]
MFRHLIIILCLGLLANGLKAQQRPVSVTFNLTAPTSIYLSDLTAMGSESIKIFINNGDENEPSLDVALNVTIEGGGVSIHSRPDFPYEPITLEVGSQVFTGSDLQQYFDPDHMVLSGISRKDLGLDGRLPEGMYTFCVEVTDYVRRDKVLSAKSCDMAMLHFNNPPTNIYPECGSTIATTSMQNIQFHWQANHDPILPVRYLLDLVEMHDGIGANDALNGAATLMIEDFEVMGTDFNYGPDQPELIPGHTYAYRVKVVSLDDEATFENDGVGEACTFTFGMDELGSIDITAPLPGTSIDTKRRLILAWNGPSNATSDQDIYYRIKMARVQDDQNLDDAINGPLYIDQSTEVVPQHLNWNYILEDSLPMQSKFALQVEAYVADELIAKSEATAISSGAIIDHFYAAGKRVDVLTLDDDKVDLGLSGTGRIQIDKEGTMIPVAFKNLKIGIYESGNILEEGEMISTLNDFKREIDLAEDGDAFLEASHLVLTTEHLMLRGRVAWKLPHALDNGAIPTILTKAYDFIFDEYELEGIPHLENNSLALLEPYGFTLTIDSTSTLNIFQDKGKLLINGSITLPQMVHGKAASAVIIPFVRADNMYLIHTQGTAASMAIYPLEELDIFVKPEEVTIDLSESVSPGNKADNPGWKGVSLTRYSIQLPLDEDASHQISYPGSTWSYAQVANDKAFASVDQQGLDFEWEQIFSEDVAPGVHFNTFPGLVKTWKISIKNNALIEGFHKGSISIPVLGDDRFDYTLPIMQKGFAVGYLDEDLEGLSQTFDVGDEMKEMVLSILTASFADNNRLNMGVRLRWPHLKTDDVAAGEGINASDFRVYGDGAIGFGGPHGQIPVENMATGQIVDMYDIQIDSVGAFATKDQYVFHIHFVIPLGLEISSIDGPPRSQLYSTADHGHEDNHNGTQHNGNHDNPAHDNHGHGAHTGTDGFGWNKEGSTRMTWDYKDNQIKIPNVSFAINGVMQVTTGNLTISNGNDVWGIGFRGNLSLKFFIPAQFEIKAKVMIGKLKDNSTYIFVEGGFGALKSKHLSNAERPWNNELIDDTSGSDDEYSSDSDDGHAEHGHGHEMRKGLSLAPFTFHALRFRGYYNLKMQLNEHHEPELLPTGDGSWGAGFGFEVGIAHKAEISFDGSLNFTGGSLRSMEFETALELELAAVEAEIEGKAILDFHEELYLFEVEADMSKPWCVNAAVELEWHHGELQKIKVGSLEDPVGIYPGPCAAVALQFNGFFLLDPQDVGMGLGAAIKSRIATEWLEIPVVKANIRGAFQMGSRFMVYGSLAREWPPKPKRLGGLIEAYVDLDVESKIENITDKIRIAHALVRGQIEYNFIEKQLSLKAYAELEILGIQASLDIQHKIDMQTAKANVIN